MKKFFINVKNWFVKHAPSKRRLIQIYAALLYNANIKGFVQGRIYTGATKNICAPGLNCYSCPGAVSACPLGALQNALSSSNIRAPYYVLGIIALFCITLGRTVCGFLCPVGLGQELLYKIKTPKLKKNRVTRVLSYLKYILLVVLVCILPIMLNSPTFCKYICPAGTFGGGIGLLVHPENAGMFDMLGTLFTWKFVLLVVIIVLSIFCYRAFCRFLCPLGALYGLFNKIALLGVRLDQSKCTDCGLCLNHCKMDVAHVGDHECIECGECIAICPTKAITWKGSKIFLHPNAVAAAEVAEAELEKIDLLSINTVQETAVEESQIEEEVKPVEVKTASAPLERIKKRNTWLERAAWIAASLLLVFALIYYNFLAPADNPIVIDKNAPCPQFTVQGYNGKETYSYSESEGKVVVLNFWATWCPPCVAELPHFNKLQQAYADDVVVVAIHGTDIDEDVSAFIANREGWSDFSIIFCQDEKGIEIENRITDNDGVETTEKVTVNSLYEYFGGKAIWPMTIVIDREGKISFTKTGRIPEYEELENLVLPIINK
ncbi:MAG: redoxin family protein [Clostridia bacterium]|nr:redoxin family protein [Clostridia bacterium]